MKDKNENNQTKITEKKNMFKIKVLIVLGIFLFMAFTLLSGGKPDSGLIVRNFSIKKGDSAWIVTRNLKAEGLIDKRIAFVLHIYKEKLQKEIKAGNYELNSNLSNSEIAEIITRGKIIEEDTSIKVTFPEGWSIAQMANRLAENGFSREHFLELAAKPAYFATTYGFDFLQDIPEDKSIEGFLFPDTYFLDQKMDEEGVIKKMLENFDEKLSSSLRQEIRLQEMTIYETITMASLIEKEVRSEGDKKIVAGVFKNRLEIGQALQSCATLAFIRGDNKMQYSYEDTKIDSPYNTYLYPNLPPGPIANPGIASIEASIYPVETDYLYFLSNPETGETVFSRTLEEHNNNKVKNGL